MQGLDLEIPTNCVQYKRFVSLANEYTHLPNISYYILLHVAMQCIEVDQAFSTKVISHLEQNKANIPDLDQKRTGEQMEQQALGLFTLSVKQDEVQPTAITAKQYLNASVLLDCLVVFENVDNIEKYKEMSKFAKLRAKTILSDLKTKGSSEPYKNDSIVPSVEPSAPLPDIMQTDESVVSPEPRKSPRFEHKLEPKPVIKEVQPPKTTIAHSQVPVYQPTVSTFKISGSYVQDIKQVQKLCKHVSSALEYDDLKTAEDLLAEAMGLVQRHRK